eukprot:2776109-Prymnesium_polylepis.3
MPLESPGGKGTSFRLDEKTPGSPDATTTSHLSLQYAYFTPSPTSTFARKAAAQTPVFSCTHKALAVGGGVRAEVASGGVANICHSTAFAWTSDVGRVARQRSAEAPRSRRLRPIAARVRQGACERLRARSQRRRRVDYGDCELLTALAMRPDSADVVESTRRRKRLRVCAPARRRRNKGPACLYASIEIGLTGGHVHIVPGCTLAAEKSTNEF